jgi:threonylcarbamoyladenosine tRNA methylthiotransferase MtaB
MRRMRATLKVQDGCVHFCGFCSIPFTRSTMASRDLPAVLSEARSLAQSGVRELVVTGVCVGAYKSGEHDLADLLTQTAAIPGLDRVRLSSIQPIETDERLINALARCPAIAPHLHLSLQAGDDSVLQGMGRPYDTAYYRGLVSRLRVKLPEIGITTDIIVGFPGETAEMFENTVSFAEEMQFARTHVFRYSPRQRTHAAEHLADDVSCAEKERRHKRLTGVCRASQAAFAARCVGRTVDVLVEGRGIEDGWMSGYTGNYIRVQFPCDRSRLGEIVPVAVAEVNDDGDAVGSLCLAGCAQ